MLLDNQPYTLDRIARLILKVLILAALLYLLNYLREVLIPFAAAFLLAYLLNPLVTHIQRRTKSRAMAVGVALGLVLLLLLVLAFLLVPMIFSEFAALKPLLQRLASIPPPAWLDRLLPSENWKQLFQQAADSTTHNFFESDHVQMLARQIAQRILPGMWNVITGAFSILLGTLGLAIVLLYTIFLLVDYDRIRNKWTDYLPPAYRKPIREFVLEFNEAMKRYFRGQALIAFIVGCLFCLGFWLINLPLALFFGMFIGLLNMIPYLQVVGMIPVFILAVLSGLALDAALWWRLPALTLIVLVSVQTTQDLVLIPRILGRTTGLSPALILLSLAVWGRLLGVLGLLIAIPMTCLLLAYYRRFLAPPATTRLPTNPA